MVNNLRRKLKWKGGLITIVSLGVFISTLLYLMPRNPFSPSLPINAHRPIVVLRQGKFVGIEVEAGYPQILEAFTGIPYAQSTAGDRRFLPPLPVNASTKEFDASTFGDRCPDSEDCLNANIYRPKDRGSGQKLPVVIHFHGGAFNFGAGDSSQSLSHFVAWSKEPMIGIGFNYRIGAFGFLASGFMAENGLLNVGLKDQVLLMEWVKENIAEFGGDPDNVTVMGSSAGAHSVCLDSFMFFLIWPLFTSLKRLQAPFLNHTLTFSDWSSSHSSIQQTTALSPCNPGIRCLDGQSSLLLLKPTK